jgi:hypothetical protein
VKTVKVTVKTTSNTPSQTDLFVEVDDITNQSRQPVAAFSSLKAAAAWLKDAGFTYVIGTNGVYNRDATTARKNAAPYPSVSLGEGGFGSQGINGEQQPACGVRLTTQKLGRLGATLRPGNRHVAGNPRSGTADKGDMGE